MKYNIYRFYYKKRPRKLIKKNVSLDEAKEHCINPETSKVGKWFDGFQKVRKGVGKCNQ